MRRLSFLTLLCALVLAGAGCGSERPDKAPLMISFQGAASGPLKGRSADMRRAAELELEAIKGKASGHPIELIDGPNRGAVATIDALAAKPTTDADQLVVSLGNGAVAQEAPRITLPPADRRARSALESYKASGAPGSSAATPDSPTTPGTPAGRYVTAALSEHSYPPAGSNFFKNFNEKYDRAPDRWAIYGYEAVGLIIDAIARLEKAGRAVTQKSVAAQALSIRNRFGPVGHYDVLPSGETTLYIFQARGAGAPDGPASLIEDLR